MVNLATGQGRIAIKYAVCAVYKVEQFPPDILAADFLSGIAHTAETIPLRHDIRKTAIFPIQAVRHRNAPLNPVDFLRISVTLKMFLVVGMVVESDECAQFVKALHQHSLGVEIGESQRAFNLGHSSLKTPFLHCFEQCGRNLLVILEVNPAETHPLLAPGFVGLGIQDCSHPADQPSVLVGKEEIGFGEIEGGIGFPVEDFAVIGDKSRNIIWISLVQLVRILRKFLQVCFRLCFLDLNRHRFQVKLVHVNPGIARHSPATNIRHFEQK